MKLSELGEFQTIERLAKLLGKPSSRVVLGIGDDAAVLQAQSSKFKNQIRLRRTKQIQNSRSQTLLLITTDALVEHVHFKVTSKKDYYHLGYKALAVNISDIAAMGGLPTYALVTIGASKNTSIKALEDIYRGINKLAKKYKIDIVGGDTVCSRDLVVSITLLGEVESKSILTRAGAKLGDAIVVTGKFGQPAVKKFNLKLKTNPRLKEAQQLAKSKLVTAMIDSSDGLARSIQELCKASKVGAKLDFEQIPIAQGATLKQALYGGEEYELVFTLPKKSLKKVQKIVKCQVVGQIVKKAQGTKLKKGFQHFDK